VFHVEISAGFHRARVFNLERSDLHSQVLGPWRADRTIEMGDREWRPHDSALRVLEGPRMENADLTFGQGWANAERASRDVTREVLAAMPAPREPQAFAIETDSPEALAATISAEHGGRTLQWSEAEERIGGRNPQLAAVILLYGPPDSS
jgi:hypothetical protein